MAPLQYFHTRVEFWVGCFFFLTNARPHDATTASGLLFDVFVNEINELAIVSRQGLPDNTVFNFTVLCALLLLFSQF